jgi:hypothetical protein
LVASSKVSGPSAIDGGVTAVDGQSFDFTTCADGVVARVAGVVAVTEPLAAPAEGWLARPDEQAARTLSARKTAMRRRASHHGSGWSASPSDVEKAAEQAATTAEDVFGVT